MRRAKDPTFLFEGNTLIGINLGADYVSGHEWGIPHIKTCFGVPSRLTRRNSGLKFRTATKQHPHLLLMTYGQYTYLVSMSEFSWRYVKDQNDLDRIMRIREWDKDAELIASWIDGGGSGQFGIRTATPDGADALRQIYDAAFRSKPDIAFTLAGGGPFQNAGLTILMPSKVPKELSKQVMKQDRAVLKLTRASDKTGIKKKLKAAGKEWYALQPDWSARFESSKSGDVKTRHKVMYFLNPKDQRKYDHGWFTVEQLEDWINDRGPVLKVSASTVA